MEIRLGKHKSWKPIISDPPIDHGLEEAPVVIKDFQKQYDQLGLSNGDTTRWNKRQWEVSYTRFKDEIKKYNDWQEKELFIRSEIIERLSPHI